MPWFLVKELMEKKNDLTGVTEKNADEAGNLSVKQAARDKTRK